MNFILTVTEASFKNIFQDINFKIKKGESLCILGPNGAGKTSLLKALVGVNKLSTGTIKYTKNVVASYIPQHLGLVRNKTVHYNILLGYLPKLSFWDSLFHKFPEEAHKKAEHLLDFFQLTKFKNTKAYSLSGGEKRRLAIARALMLSPDLLIADEIFADLDFVKSKQIIEKLKTLQKDGLSIIMVEHDLCIAREMSENIALLNNKSLKLDVNFKEISDLKLCKLFK